jgi:hypothetical protein
VLRAAAEPPSPADRRARDERAAAVERDGMSVLVDYMHAGLYRCPSHGMSLPAVLPSSRLAGARPAACRVTVASRGAGPVFVMP